MCQKVPYQSRKEALEDARQIRINRNHFSKRVATRPKSGRKLKPYLCPVCDVWHLTTRKK